MAIQIRYPSTPIGVDTSGLERGLAGLGDRFQQRRQEKRQLAEAEKIFGQMGAAPQGSDDFNKYTAWANGLGGGMSLDKLDPRGVTRASLPAVDSAPVRQQAAGNIDNGNGGSVFGRFMKAVQGGRRRCQFRGSRSSERKARAVSLSITRMVGLGSPCSWRLWGQPTLTSPTAF